MGVIPWIPASSPRSWFACRGRKSWLAFALPVTVGVSTLEGKSLGRGGLGRQLS